MYVWIYVCILENQFSNVSFYTLGTEAQKWSPKVINQHMEFESKSLYFGGNSITYNLFEAKRDVATQRYHGDLNLFICGICKQFMFMAVIVLKLV